MSRRALGFSLRRGLLITTTSFDLGTEYLLRQKMVAIVPWVAIEGTRRPSTNDS